MIRCNEKARSELLQLWNKRLRLIDLGFGQESCVLVAGTARSGTTWIGNVVAHATRSRQIFEPFLQDGTFRFALRSSRHPTFGLYQPYAPAGSEPGGWVLEVERILQGRIRHWWCDRFNTQWISRRRVIKAVRVNLLLDFFAARWPRMKILFLVRNPLSVVNSQIAKMRQGWEMAWKPEYVLSQPSLMADWLDPYRSLIVSSTSVVQRQAMKWCIETWIPLQSLADHENVLIVRYDELVAKQQSWCEIASFLRDRSWSPARFAEAVGRVSAVAERSAAQIARGDEALSELNESDRQTIFEIVEQFQLSEFLPCPGFRSQAA